MKVLDKIWSKNAESFMNVKHSSQENVLHPTLANLINEQNPKHLLDYGCGDGRILKKIKKNISIDVHDINKEMLELCEFNLGKRISSYYLEKDSIPSKKYDAILLSMVLVCINNEKDFLSILNKIKISKTQEGRVYIAVTHPCFRDKNFSNFKTSFCSNQTYEYLKDGQPFNVFIEDDKPPFVGFTDFHWTLSFTINKIVESGLFIERIIETPDDIVNKNCNKLFSPYLILIAK